MAAHTLYMSIILTYSHVCPHVSMHAIMHTGHSVYIDVEYTQIIHRHVWFYKDCTETIHTHRLHEFTTNIRTRYLTASAGKTHTVFSHTNGIHRKYSQRERAHCLQKVHTKYSQRQQVCKKYRQILLGDNMV